MPRFLDEANLQGLFRERYLRIHDPCLKGIADIAATLFNRAQPDEDFCRNMMVTLISGSHGPPVSRSQDSVDAESDYFKDLRNSWYNEFAMRTTPPEVAAWKIIQAYYAVFCSISSIVRCHHPRRANEGHKWMLRKYSEEFVSSRTGRNQLLPPSNLYAQGGEAKGKERIKWPYGLENHVPSIFRGLEWARERWKVSSHGVITIPMYLYSLREWVNYSDSYLFFLMYGESVKRNLEFSLETITFLYATQAEYYLARTFGWEAQELQYETFLRQLDQKLHAEAPFLEARFSAMSHAF